MKNSEKTYQPVADRVFVQPPPAVTEATVGGIIVPPEVAARQRSPIVTLRVLAVGPDCKQVKAGDRVMRREDPCRGDPHANPRDDKSHALVRLVEKLKHHPNYFGAEGIRGLRKRVLAGEPFPAATIPEHCWFTGKLLSEL